MKRIVRRLKEEEEGSGKEREIREKVRRVGIGEMIGIEYIQTGLYEKVRGIKGVCVKKVTRRGGGGYIKIVSRMRGVKIEKSFKIESKGIMEIERGEEMVKKRKKRGVLNEVFRDM